jgi:hypothetical protein
LTPADEKDEALAILGPRLEALTLMSWREMDAYGKQEETVKAPSGRTFRVVTAAFWDMDEWASGMELYAEAYSESGPKSLRPLTAVDARYTPARRRSICATASGRSSSATRGTRHPRFRRTRRSLDQRARPAACAE